MLRFTVVWLGQIVSLLGTGISNFALTLWVYQITGKVTPLALVGFFYVTPVVLVGPFVGVLVDRGDRRLMMMVSDLSAALVTLCTLSLYVTGNLEIWYLYVFAAISGIFQSFQWPAFSAAITLMMPKEHYGRANGMMEMAGNASGVSAPLLAGILIGPLGLGGILAIDLVSAAVAIGTLVIVRIPQPTSNAAGRAGEGSVVSEALFGLRYILARPSLLGLQSVFLIANFACTLSASVLAPMILGCTGNNELILGSVQSAGAVGGVAGGLAMSV
jgi:DHA3 family macrolide efflux protein-like MFS transporter